METIKYLADLGLPFTVEDRPLASIEDGDQTLDFPWASEESEYAYYDTLPAED